MNRFTSPAQADGELIGAVSDANGEVRQPGQAGEVGQPGQAGGAGPAGQADQADEERFFIRVRPGDRVLCCRVCGSRVRIEDQPGAMDKAKADHVCAMPCGCWSPAIHESSTACPGDT
jgi:hypothetical protein